MNGGIVYLHTHSGLSCQELTENCRVTAGSSPECGFPGDDSQFRVACQTVSIPNIDKGLKLGWQIWLARAP